MNPRAALLGATGAPGADPPALTTRGTCHGFTVRTDLPLKLTRDTGGGDEALEMRRADAWPVEPATAPVRRWEPAPGRPFSARLHRLPDSGYGFWADRLAFFRVEPRARRIQVAPAEGSAHWEPRLWGIPSALCFTAHGDLSLHAAAVEVDGRALLLAAPGRSGKTTLAAGFHVAGHRVLAEDLCRCRVDPVPVAYPGPAMLRVRHDSYAHLGPIPHTQVKTRDRERVHVAVDAEARGDGRPVPLGAIVTVNVDDGPPRLERATPEAAIPDLWAMSFHVPTDEDRARCFQGVAALAHTVPVWRLTRRPTYEGLPGLVEQLRRVASER